MRDWIYPPPVWRNTENGRLADGPSQFRLFGKRLISGDSNNPFGAERILRNSLRTRLTPMAECIEAVDN